MRVLHLIKGLGPGGAERLLLSLSSARSDDVDVHVAYVLPHKHHLVDALSAAQVNVHLIGSRHGMTDPRWLIGLASLAKRIRPDVVHVHSPALAAGAVPLLRARRSRPRLVTTEHNVWGSFGALTRVANGLALVASDRRLAVSEEARSSVWPRLRERVDVVVQGIPLADLRLRRVERVAARSALDLDDDETLVVTVANFREKKDYPTLLAAAAACADEPRLRFLAIGQGPLEQEMHALHLDLGLGDRFRFLGYHPDPPSVVAAADIFTLTSLHEGLPISLLEAMALGVAPVVSAVGGIPEVITDRLDGVLVEAGDPARFAATYRQLAADPSLRRRLGGAAARRAEDFDIAETQRRLEAIYRELLATRS